MKNMLKLMLFSLVIAGSSNGLLAVFNSSEVELLTKVYFPANDGEQFPLARWVDFYPWMYHETPHTAATMKTELLRMANGRGDQSEAVVQLIEKCFEGEGEGTHLSIDALEYIAGEGWASKNAKAEFERIKAAAAAEEDDASSSSSGSSSAGGDEEGREKAAAAVGVVHGEHDKAQEGGQSVEMTIFTRGALGAHPLVSGLSASKSTWHIDPNFDFRRLFGDPDFSAGLRDSLVSAKLPAPMSIQQAAQHATQLLVGQQVQIERLANQLMVVQQQLAAEKGISGTSSAEVAHLQVLQQDLQQQLDDAKLKLQQVQVDLAAQTQAKEAAERAQFAGRTKDDFDKLDDAAIKMIEDRAELVNVIRALEREKETEKATAARAQYELLLGNDIRNPELAKDQVKIYTDGWRKNLIAGYDNNGFAYGLAASVVLTAGMVGLAFKYSTATSPSDFVSDWRYYLQEGLDNIHKYAKYGLATLVAADVTLLGFFLIARHQANLKAAENVRINTMVEDARKADFGMVAAA